MNTTVKYILIICFIIVLVSCAPTMKQSPAIVENSQAQSASIRLRKDLHKIVEQISEQPLRETRPRIAVIDFADTQNNVPAISHVISETLISELFKTGKYVIVERKLLTGVLEQQKLNMSGLVDEGTARKVGKLLGVDYIVTGTLINIGDALNVNARMISIESGVIEATGATDLSKKDLSSLKLTTLGTPPGESTTLLADLPPVEGVFSQWKGADEFGREIDNYWKDGYYPSIVEGRNFNGQSQFRAVVQPFPKTAWWFYWWYDQVRSSYEEHRQKLIAEGFKEIHVQVFTDHDGMRKYQTCWIKLPAPDKTGTVFDTSTQFKINKNGTVTDTVTQFMWQQVDDGIERNWAQATSYCENLNLGEHGGWRLPTTEQLKTIIDTTRENPSIDTTYFPNAKSACYWSCAMDGKVRSNAWVIDFHNGYMTSDFKTNKYYVRCVR